MRKSFSFDVLSDGSLVLTLGETCIRTTAKQAHRELTLALFDGHDSEPVLDALVDMLECFLTNTDFAALRAGHPELAGGTRCNVRLYRHEDGGVRWELVQSR